MNRNNQQTVEYTVGSDNIFADLQLEDAQELHRRAQIGFFVYRLLDERQLKQREIGQLLGISQPDVSHLMNGHFSRFTTDKLLDFLQQLDRKVTIHISPHQEGEAYEEVVMAL